MSDNIEFYITLPSNDPSFPKAQNPDKPNPNEQSPNNFGIRFPQPINLSSEYQVALYEMFFNCKQYDATTEEDGLVITNSGDIPNDLFVYCDLIEAQVVGSNEVRLLKHINNNKINESQVFRGTEPLQFVDVIAKHIPQVKLQVNDQKGRPVPMQGTTVMVLAFRKKP